MTSASLKVSVNGRKFQVSGITKQTSCKDLLCALAKVTTTHAKGISDACSAPGSKGEFTESITNFVTTAPDHVLHEGKLSAHNELLDDTLSGLSKDLSGQVASQNKVKQVAESAALGTQTSQNKGSKDNSTCLECHEGKERSSKRSIYHVKRVLEESTYLSIEQEVNCGEKESESSQSVTLRAKSRKQSKSKRLSANFDSTSTLERNKESKKEKRKKHRSWTFSLEEDKEAQSKQIIETLILCSENSVSSPGTEKSRNSTNRSTSGKKISPRNSKAEDHFLRDHLRVVLKEKALEIREIPVHTNKGGIKKQSRTKTNNRGSKSGKGRGKRSLQETSCSSAVNSDNTASLDRRITEAKKVMHPKLDDGTEFKDYGSLQNLSSQTKEIKAQMKEMKKAEFLHELRKNSPTYIIDENAPKDREDSKPFETEIENDNDSGVQTVEYDSSQEMDASPAEVLSRVEEGSGFSSNHASPVIEEQNKEVKQETEQADNIVTEERVEKKVEEKIEKSKGIDHSTERKSSTSEGNGTLKRKAKLSFDDLCIPKDSSFDSESHTLTDVCSVSTQLGNRSDVRSDLKKRPSLRKTENCLDLTRVTSGKSSNIPPSLLEGGRKLSISSEAGRTNVPSCSYVTRKELISRSPRSVGSSSHRQGIQSPDASRRRHSIPRSESLSELSLVSVLSDSKSSSGDEKLDDRDVIGQYSLDRRSKKDKANAKAIWQETYQRTKLFYDYRQLTKSLMELLDELLYKELLVVHLSAKLQATDEYSNEADDRLIVMEEMAIAKDLMGLKNLTRSVTELTKYQRREMQEVSEEIQYTEWEISKQTYEFESLEMKLANQRTKGAPRALVKRKKSGPCVGSKEDDDEENVVSLV